ncbi:dihydrodipicolinate synthase family protein [Curtobacterium pusillum]|uniref:4-hydroxy-tetrahydrodipicolinate synthase n=1 Tax=Curtobacterium pusillum TaxID=69373 RepID=A0AAW3T7V0_9MICO|nr:dihydrodipicolinate synthase family protein [Curtobacterium pusillum]MBA8991027.1 4-hydroxy-tetrahydrodipicolinate synthase [Curtobacterium pusillum]NUU15145.1 dihydrodipicolinate synthase family protein [Curtobacterium pusillum]GLK31527.1 dihydrodipicolinate synthase family protein [Curtobacterium pusillum]
MNTHRFGGVVPPLVTPFAPDGSLDVASFERLIESQLSAGVDGLFVLGSSGEVGFLSDAVRNAVMQEAVRITAGRVPVLAGVNDMSTARVLDQVRIAELAGVDAVVATVPFYVRPSAIEAEEHFRTIAAATELPVFAYDVPVRVGVKLGAEMLVRLGVDGVLVGVKDSSGDDVGFRRLVAANRAAGSPLALFTGHEIVVDGALLAGADGVVPGLGNVDPVAYVNLFAAAKAGDWDEVRRLQDDVAALFEIVFQAEGVSGEAAGIGAFKAALAGLGVIADARMAHPVPPLDAATTERINRVVEASGRGTTVVVG